MRSSTHDSATILAEHPAARRARARFLWAARAWGVAGMDVPGRVG